MRNTVDFNSDWRFCKTDVVPETLPDWERIDLPHTWNAVDGQDGGNDYWRGTAMYCKSFPRPTGERIFLEFPGAAMTADVYVNGQHLVHHEGGYSAFRVDITHALRDENLVCVAVDNSENQRVYPQKADFTFYGGLYRGVRLLCLPREHFTGIPGIHVTPVVDLGKRTAHVTVETWQTGGNVTMTICGETKTVPSVDGYAKGEFLLEDVRLWDGVSDPYLYSAEASLDSGDSVSARFGCREFHCDPERGFFLNGRSYPLRGVSRHQDRKGLGNALTTKEHQEDMDFIREIGANTVRLAHYQHDPYFYDLCDENGIVVWAEIPYVTMDMPGGRGNTLSQMEELVTQNYNHPSIVCWGLSNEITAAGEADEGVLENHRRLNDLCHRLDKTRLTTMASVFMLETDSPLLEIPDIGSYNLYYGWYLGELQQNDSFFDQYHAQYPNRCIGLSEYGADANPRFQSPNPEKGDYTEGYQCLYHEHMLEMIEARPYLWATHVWNLFDFAADGRDEGGVRGVNQKGLVTMDRKLKKDAFYLYKAAWSKTPFVRLCGRRYANRSEAETEIKVYSNASEVTLSVDGREVSRQQGRRVFRFRVPITGEHHIRAVAGECSDTMTIRHVSEPDPRYSLGGGQTVVNWFDREAFRPDCFSTRDTLGSLMADPRTAAIVGRIMDAARASRGDVATAAAGNQNLERLIGRMPLEKLLKMAGPAITPEQIRSLNDALQKIKKEN